LAAFISSGHGQCLCKTEAKLKKQTPSRSISLPNPVTTQVVTLQGAGAKSEARVNQIAQLVNAYFEFDHFQIAVLVREYVELVDNICGQNVHKSIGRPEGGIARAARELRVPGRTADARRKWIERALTLCKLSDAAKAAADRAGLKGRKTALLEVAREATEELQLAKIERLSAERQLRSPTMKGPTAAGEAPRKTESEIGGLQIAGYRNEEPLPSQDLTIFNALIASWNGNKALCHSWDQASAAVRERFIAFLQGYDHAERAT
jgi:hypothetical protein